jgi:type I restriction enzyme S subunit
MNTPYIKKELFKTARRAAGMANINTSELRKLPLILPPISAQQDFIKKLYQFNDCASTSASSRYQLERLFQAMLHRAFNGELTAGWREAHMKEILTEMEHQSKALGKREEAA